MGTSDYVFLVMAAVGFGILAFAIIASPAQSIPPTPAFSKVYVNGIPITADSFEDKLYITTEGIITTTITGKSVKFTAKQPAMTCPVLQGVMGFDSSGLPICGVI